MPTLRHQQALIVLIPLLLRLPLLFLGYGVEEDAWGHVLNAIEIDHSGHYILSRLPGHPAMEGLCWVLLQIVPESYLGWNLLFALAGSWASLEFFRIAHRHEIRGALWLSLGVQAVPALLFAGTTPMDYIFQLALLLWAYRLWLDGKWWWVGVALGLALSFRLTSALFGVALFAQWLSGRDFPFTRLLRVGLPAILIAGIAYLPAYLQMGSAFFSTYSLPYPPLPKALFKGSFGLFGPVGMLATAFLTIMRFRHRPSTAAPVVFWWSMLLLHALLYIRLPEKSAFLLPALPFLFLWLSHGLGPNVLRGWALAMVAGLFVFGINLHDPLRGSAVSSQAVKKVISGQTIAFDPLLGPYFGEWTKRQNKLAYVEALSACAEERAQGEVVIAGWWYALLEVQQWQRHRRLSGRYRYYLDEEALRAMIASGRPIFALPEQEAVNHRKHGTAYLSPQITPYPCP